ncbi:hypothetical protein RB195_001210 [Necator americanus]|uniref:Uncharacterized protein n=1 Tax=Necator americanus TaxID=51031 RepID=A0ABR1DD65_NECAM
MIVLYEFFHEAPCNASFALVPVPSAINTINRWNNHGIQNMDGKGQSLLVRSLRQPLPLASSPSQRRCACHHRRPPFRNANMVKNRTSLAPFSPSALSMRWEGFTRYPSVYKVSKQRKTVLLYKKGKSLDIGRLFN